ncbi:MAG: glycosyltransferase family 9 protein [Planctomycetota bacterium]
MVSRLTAILRRVPRAVFAWLIAPMIRQFLKRSVLVLMGARCRHGDVNLQHAKRVLVIRLDEIGDMVMATPFLRELRRNLPRAWITLVVKPATYNLVEFCPYVNEVLSLDLGPPTIPPTLENIFRTMRFARERLRHRRFDIAVIPRWDADWYHAPFLACFSRIPTRLGYSEKVTVERRRLNRGFDRLLTYLMEGHGVKHEVERNLDVVRFMGGIVEEDALEVWLAEDDEAFAESVFLEHGVSPEQVVAAFSPSGGRSPLKKWRTSNSVELGRWLRDEVGARVLVVGAPTEKALGVQISDALGADTINLVGMTTLRQLAAVLGRSRLFVGNDAGPMHIAVAAGVPVVALFGPSCPHRFGPWGDGHSVLQLGLPCGPCSRAEHVGRCARCTRGRLECMVGIKVEHVKQAVRETLLR